MKGRGSEKSTIVCDDDADSPNKCEKCVVWTWEVSAVPVGMMQPTNSPKAYRAPNDPTLPPSPVHTPVAIQVCVMTLYVAARSRGW